MNKLTRQQAQKHAKVMREFAAKYRADGLKEWKDEADMIAMILGDAKDYRKIAQLLRLNKIGEASDLAQSMDTSPRETIPDSVWNVMIGEEY
tara:strand:- start:4210 stop:4485 length:276 start_codon:yes stop_codon:yes gene_type:complete